MRMKLSKDDISNVKRAREEGRLHTELLDRRAGMKSDKYCKWEKPENCPYFFLKSFEIKI